MAFFLVPTRWRGHKVNAISYRATTRGCPYKKSRFT